MLVEGRQVVLVAFLFVTPVLALLHLQGHRVRQGGRGSSDVVLGLLQVLVQLLHSGGQSVRLPLHPLELRPHDVLKFVLNDVELHCCVRTIHGRAEGQPRVVCASVLSVLHPLLLLSLTLCHFLRAEGPASQLCPKFGHAVIIFLRCRTGDLTPGSSRGGRWIWDQGERGRSG